MLLNHVWGLLTHPRDEWLDIRSRANSTESRSGLFDLFFLAMIPGISSFIGSVYFGWSATGLDPVKVSMDSAAIMSIASWLAMIAGTVFMGLFIHWMERTYGSHRNYLDCVCFAVYVATPLYLTGLSGLYPSIPLTMLAVLLGIGWSAYLLYLGTPLFMDIPKERGFLFATSIVCVALVLLVSMKVATVLLWDLGFGPEFIPD
ncbi:Yip1 family protein [Endozoicomonas montiporae]|uniref:Yip1 domain-containing protein n=1 Tax=Endozoicomonas montiporae CL-33 TaxID=570277 RepID=A0A142BF54_9GAMM|nr:Yip1 family protein [Endozoicomonas montiporae]AMO57380.1 hypothetical protein EZMO1_3389 [Endozoicomonas montiporae CL-33]